MRPNGNYLFIDPETNLHNWRMKFLSLFCGLNIRAQEHQTVLQVCLLVSTPYVLCMSLRNPRSSIFIYMYFIWWSLHEASRHIRISSVPVYNVFHTGTVPVYNVFNTGTVPVYNVFKTGTVPVYNFFLLSNCWSRIEITFLTLQYGVFLQQNTRCCKVNFVTALTFRIVKC